MPSRIKSVAVVAALLAGGGMAVAVTASGGNTNGERPGLPQLPSPDTQSSARFVEPSDALRHQIGDELVEEFGLSFDRTTELVAPATASGRSERWTIVPGTEGVCLSIGESALGCSPMAVFDEGQFVIVRLAAAGGPVPKDLTNASREQLVGTGEGHVQGVVPAGYSKAVARDADGNEIATAEVNDQLYDLVIPDSRRLATVELVSSTGVRKVL
jgi:hypothetical protein